MLDMDSMLLFTRLQIMALVFSCYVKCLDMNATGTCIRAIVPA